MKKGENHKSALPLQGGYSVVAEFAEARVLNDERRRVPHTPKFLRQSVLVADDGGCSRKRELQIRHVNAPNVDVCGVQIAVSRIVDAAAFEDFERCNEHPSASAARIRDGDDLVAVRLLSDEFFRERDFRHEVGDVVGREELSRVFIAEIGVHEELAEVVVESPVVIDYGGEQREYIGEDVRKRVLIFFRIALHDLQIPFLAFFPLRQIDEVGNGDGSAFHEVGNEFVLVRAPGGAFDILHDLFDLRNRVGA